MASHDTTRNRPASGGGASDGGFEADPVASSSSATWASSFASTMMARHRGASSAEGPPDTPRAEGDPPLEEGPTVASTVKMLWGFLPLVIPPVLTILYEYWSGLALVGTVLLVMLYVDRHLETQTALKAERSIPVLTGLVVLLAATVAALFFLLRPHQLWWFLLFLAPPQPTSDSADRGAVDPLNDDAIVHGTSALTNAWIAVVTGYVVKLVVMGVKAVILIVAARAQPACRSRLLALVECVSVIYCKALPVMIWYRFLFQEYYPVALSTANMTLYLYYKGTQIAQYVRLIFLVLRSCSHADPPYGVYANEADLMELGHNTECSICRETMTRTVIKLSCDHFFCEDCIVSWLDRKKECPLCRHSVPSVVGGGARLRGNGSTSLWCWWF